MAVVTGSPGSFSVVSCSPFGLLFDALAGETYAILIFDYQDDGGGNGGSLELSVEALPPAPTIDLVVSSVGQFNSRTGAAIIRGTVSCDPGPEPTVGPTDTTGYSVIDVGLSQRVGRFTITGWGMAEFVCDGTAQPWSVEVVPFNGKFAGGKASLIASARSCSIGGCGEALVEQVVSLKR